MPRAGYRGPLMAPRHVVADLSRRASSSYSCRWSVYADPAGPPAALVEIPPAGRTAFLTRQFSDRPGRHHGLNGSELALRRARDCARIPEQPPVDVIGP